MCCASMGASERESGEKPCVCVCIKPFDHSPNNNPLENESNERVASG